MLSTVAITEQKLEFRCDRCWHSNCVSCEKSGHSVNCCSCGAEQTVPEATPARIARAAELASSSTFSVAEAPEKPYEEMSETELRKLVQQETAVPASQQDFSGMPLASCTARFFAQVVDGIAGMLLIGLGAVAAVVATKAGLIQELNPENPAASIEFLAVFSFPFLAFVLVQWNLIATRGQTVGKMLLFIRIVNCKGTSPGFIQGVILRNWLRVALSTIPFFGLIDILFILTESKRCIHDYLAGTRVIQAH